MLIKAYEKELGEYQAVLGTAEAMAEELQYRIAQLYNEMLVDTNLMQLPSGMKATDSIFEASRMMAKLYEDLHELDTAVIRAIDIYDSTEKLLLNKMSEASDYLQTACTMFVCNTESNDAERIDSTGIVMKNQMLGKALGIEPAEMISTDIGMVMDDLNQVYLVAGAEPDFEEDEPHDFYT